MELYKKDGKDCILCLTRKKLIQVTPEEEVRQNFIQKLVDEYDVPIKLIESEIPLSYYKKGARGRVDILISALDKVSSSYPLMIVECKAPTIPLTDKTFQQIVRYDAVLQAKVIVLTNSIDTYCFAWDDKIKDYKELKELPNYKDLVEDKKLDYKKKIEYKRIRTNHLANLADNRAKLLENASIGTDTKDEYVPLITNLVGLLYEYDDNHFADFLPLKTKKLVSDKGLRFTTFGNASGGSWTGNYRYFIVENDNKEHEIVSISILGNEVGTTAFIIAIDDFENSHNSLQYSIDKHVTKNDNKYSFWHNGRLTLGKRGPAKNNEVIDFISKNGNHLIKNGKIFLGEIDNTKEFKWQQNSVKELIANFIDYGFLRDQFRKEKKEGRI